MQTYDILFDEETPEIDIIVNKVREISGLDLIFNKESKKFEGGLFSLLIEEKMVSIISFADDMQYLIFSTIAALIDLKGKVPYELPDWAWKKWEDVKNKKDIHFIDFEPPIKSEYLEVSNKLQELLKPSPVEEVILEKALQLIYDYEALKDKPPRDEQYSGFILYEKAVVLSKLKKYDEAIEVLNNLIKQEPFDTGSILAQGLIYELDGNSERANEKYKQCIRIYEERIISEPKDFFLKLEKARIYLYLNRQNDSIKEFDYLIKEYPEYELLINTHKELAYNFNKEEELKNLKNE
jgi:tetratricopeptide (TPR) repeat protein